MNDVAVAAAVEPTVLKPYDHQTEITERTQDLPAYALFWEQGTGKTQPMIELAARLYRAGKIGALIVVTDDGIHSNWADTEIPKWIPKDIQYAIIEYHSKKAKQVAFKRNVKWVLEFRGLKILCITWDAATKTEFGKTTLWNFLQLGALMVADETSACKEEKSIRSQVLTKAMPYAKVRRILNGTPVENGPLDTYSQMLLLDKNFWMDTLGIGSFIGFKHRFAIVKNIYKADSPYRVRAEEESKKPNGVVLGREGKDYFKHVVAYKNLDQLKGAIDTLSSRKLKSEVLSLPEKIFAFEHYSPSDEEMRVYESVLEEGMAEIGDNTLTCFVCDGDGDLDEDTCPKCFGLGLIAAGLMTAEQPIVKLLRLQQVLSGYVTCDNQPIEDLPGPKPRLEALRRILERGSGPWIIWSRFKRDNDKIDALCREMGLRVGSYDGRTKSEQRSRIRQGFQAGELDVFNGNPAAASKGITLTRAQTCVYFNNSFRSGHREQSEDRVHRAGLDHKVLYIDLCAHGTVDMKIITALRNKQKLAAIVLGDQLRNWLIA